MYLLMDSAYGSDELRSMAEARNLIPIVPPTRNARILGYWISNGIANAMKSNGCFDESKRIDV